MSSQRTVRARGDATRKPLANRSILITRRHEQAGEFVRAIERQGGRAVVLPTIDISDPESWESCDTALRRLSSYDGVIFTSANAVERFLQRCVTGGMVFSPHAVYAVGEKTQRALEQKGIAVTSVPEHYSAAALAGRFAGKEVSGKAFLLPCGNLARNDLAATLIDLGGEVDVVVVYRTGLPAEADPAPLRLLEEGKIDVVAFASPSAATNFVQMVSAKALSHLTGRTKVAVIGETTAAEVRSLGLPVTIVPEHSTVEGLVQAMAIYFGAET